MHEKVFRNAIVLNNTHTLITYLKLNRCNNFPAFNLTLGFFCQLPTLQYVFKFPSVLARSMRDSNPGFSGGIQEVHRSPTSW